MVYAQTKICPREWDAQNSLGFWNTNRSPHDLQSGEQQSENQENEKRDKYLDLTKELKRKDIHHKGDSDTNYYWCTRNDLQKIGKRLEELKFGGRDETIQITL